MKENELLEELERTLETVKGWCEATNGENDFALGVLETLTEIQRASMEYKPNIIRDDVEKWMLEDLKEKYRRA
jgi:hypothetical protein